MGGPNVYSYYASQCRGKLPVKVKKNSTLIDVCECNTCRKHDIYPFSGAKFLQLQEIKIINYCKGFHANAFP